MNIPLFDVFLKTISRSTNDFIQFVLKNSVIPAGVASDKHPLQYSVKLLFLFAIICCI